MKNLMKGCNKLQVQPHAHLQADAISSYQLNICESRVKFPFTLDHSKIRQPWSLHLIDGERKCWIRQSKFSLTKK